MKQLFFSAISIAFFLTACSSNNTKKETQKDTAFSINSVIKPTDTSKSIIKGSNQVVNEVVTNYLKLKNALAQNNSKEAANAGNVIIASLSKVDINKMTTEQLSLFKELVVEVKENADHISSNTGKLDHQREHFALLSKDVTDIIKAFGYTQKLYQDFCPMYDNGKGAIWLSEFKEIKNPYFGTKMLNCGSIKKEL